MAKTLRQKDGRSWTVDNRKAIVSLKRKYAIDLTDTEDHLGENGEMANFTGLPSIGSAHPSNDRLKVVSYEFSEGGGAAKRSIEVTVNYAYEEWQTDGAGETAQTFAVDEWGWDAGTEEKELTTAADGTAVLNSAGDPFDSVPRISSPAPVFTKVMKFADRQSGAMAYSCTVNAGTVTIGGVTYPAGSLLCTVAEKRLIGDAQWKYQYTVQLKFKSNLVKVEGDSELTDIGWDVAVTDAGMREWKTEGDVTRLALIRRVDAETGKPCTVTSPELLDGEGHAVSRESGTAPEPYNFRFQAYETSTFPTWFYSEPA